MSAAKHTPGPRTVAFVSEVLFVPGCGFRVSIVFEGEDGHHPTGDWPDDGKSHDEDMPGAVRPWFWGNTITEARKACETYNTRAGVSPEEASLIIGRSMVAGTKRRSAR